MNSIQNFFKDIPQIPVSVLPTPIHRLDLLSEMFGVEIYIKRDDLTGFALGGNKTRKFDFLIADAIAKGCDTLLGIGANQSNFCRIVAGIGSRFGLNVHLVLSGEKPETPTGNLLVDHLLKATVHHVNTRNSQIRLKAAEDLRDELISQGKKVYFMPPGGSTPVGTLGYAAGFGEILDDMNRLNLPVTKIFHASSSAGTQAGMTLGQAMAQWSGEIIGISVDTEARQLQQDVYTLAAEAAKQFSVSIDIDKIITDDHYIGAGYAARTEGCREAIELFARKEGIFLDYVYTGKAAAGMIDYCRSGKIKKGETILFVHTGGFIELFE